MVVSYEVDGHVRVITIQRPQARNAIDAAVQAGLYDAWTTFRDDDDAWVAIVTGAGDDAFCAGADLKEIDPAKRARLPRVLPRAVITRDFVCDKPMIAAINGAAYGGGLELALACDLRVAAEHARLALSEARWSLIPGSGGTQRLPRLAPVAVALEMLWTAAPIGADRAYELGLVNRVAPRGEALSVARALADEICRSGPLAVRAIKEAVLRGLEVSLDEGMRIEADLQRRNYLTSDAVEGPRAFQERRTPVYVGR
jgi:enoyl-CoA hydratase/carnithine racemase